MNPRLAALDFITGCLGVRNEADINDILYSAIASGHLNWHTVIEFANIELVTPALWLALQKRGLVESLPSDVREYLCELHKLNTLRNEHLRAQTVEAVQLLNSVGIEPVLLKGSAFLFIKTFDDLGSRLMVDLDILVPQRSAEACWNILHNLGYSPISDNPDYYVDYCQHHHLRPLYRPDEYGIIEIHRDALPKGTARIMPTQLLWNHIEPLEEPGVVMSVLTPTYRVLYSLLHSEVVDRIYTRGKLNLRSLHELVLTQALYHQRVNWKRIQEVMERNAHAKVLHAWLYRAHRLFGSPLPDPMGPTLAAVAHYARTRWQVRWEWTNALVDRVLWFSAPAISARYPGAHDFRSLMKGRIRLAAYLGGKYGRQALSWLKHQLSNPQR